jgi:hypothetical protein
MKSDHKSVINVMETEWQFMLCLVKWHFLKMLHVDVGNDGFIPCRHAIFLLE